MSQQHASVSQERICRDNFTCCHTEIETADQTCCLNQSQYTDTGPTSSNSNPKMQGACRHWSASFFFNLWYDSTRKNPLGESDNRTPGLPLSRRTPQPLGQRGGTFPEHIGLKSSSITQNMQPVVMKTGASPR